MVLILAKILTIAIKIDFEKKKITFLDSGDRIVRADDSDWEVQPVKYFKNSKNCYFYNFKNTSR